MRKTHILFSNIKTDGNELAFIFPLVFNQRRLYREYKINIDFFDDHNDPKLLECDSLMISSWYFGRRTKSWIDNEDLIYSFLKLARKRKIKIIWSDISDSTGTTQLKVLPYVDVYTKGQLLKDKTLYQKQYYSARIFGDYYHQKGIHDQLKTEEHLCYPLDSAHLNKIRLGWNSGFATYSQYGPYYNFYNYKYLDLKLPIFYPKRWSSPDRKREVPLSCRIGHGYNRETMRYQRQQVKELLKDRVDTSKVERTKYFQELRNSVINVSPFGLGEISLRDFEIIVSGGLIMKANCDHMETYPNILYNESTYLSFNWDLSNFLEKLEYGIEHLPEMKQRAMACQKIYKDLLSTESGHHHFCLYLVEILNH